MTSITIRKMFEAGMHFGHRTSFWNPKLKPYIYGVYNGIHIIDLDKSYPLFLKAMGFLQSVSARGGKILFVGCKRSATRSLTENASRCGMYYLTRRWLGGTLTNFSTIRRSVNRYLALEARLERSGFSEVSKKEAISLRRELEKMRRNFEGIRDMIRPPDVLFIVDVVREKIAVKEAQVLGIPIVAILDTNCDTAGLDYVIPGNDDSLSSISLCATAAADAILAGAEQAGYGDSSDEETEASLSAKLRKTTGKTQSEAGKPADTQSEAGKPANTQSETGKPADTQSEAGKPADTQSEAGKPADTQSEAGKPDSSTSEAGKSADTQSEAGKPSASEDSSET